MAFAAIEQLEKTLPSDAIFEIHGGEIREVPHMGALAGTIASFLISAFNAFANPKRLGFAVMEVLFRFQPDLPSRRPDAAYISYERWGMTSIPTIDPPYWEVVPNLAVEVISPNNKAAEVEVKLLDYFAVGVELVWVIYPEQRRVYIYSSPTQTRILQEADELDGGSVLPGFRLKVSALFAPLVKPNGQNA